MTDMTGGRLNRALIATGALLAIAVSHPAIAQQGRPGGTVADRHEVDLVAVKSEAAFDESDATSLENGGADAAEAADALAAPEGSAGIVGTVHDPSGAAVIGADLTIRNLSDDKVQSRTSDESGAFNVQNLTP